MMENYQVASSVSILLYLYWNVIAAVKLTEGVATLINNIIYNMSSNQTQLTY